MTGSTLALVLSTVCAAAVLGQPNKIDNQLATTEVVYQPRDETFERKCTVTGAPLDLMFVVDSSGSLRKQWQEQLDVMRRVIRQLGIREDGARVSVIQYANVARQRFGFNTYYHRDDMLAAIDNLETSGSVTKTGSALNFALSKWTTENGMRPDSQNVKRILFLLSDGRASDFPIEREASDAIRARNIDIWAFGLGEYIGWKDLRYIVSGNTFSGYDRVVNSINQTKIDDWIKPWEGVTICEEVPSCIPGAHRPLDLLFILDMSSSVESRFKEAKNFVLRALNSVNLHPEATKVAIISYSSHSNVDVPFNSPMSTNHTALRDLMHVLPQTVGTTHTSKALRLAFDLYDEARGARPDAARLAIVITDGYSDTSPSTFARRLIELKDVDMFAVSLGDDDTGSSSDSGVDLQGLLDITGHNLNRVFRVQKRVFIKGRECNSDLPFECAQGFEAAMLNYTDKSCPGLKLENPIDNGVEKIVPPVEAHCSASGIRVTVRTAKPFSGTLYAIGYDTAAGCSLTGTGKDETHIALPLEQCGVRTERINGGGSRYKVTVRIGVRYHHFVDTVADHQLTADCELDDTTGVLTKKRDENAVGDTLITPNDDPHCTYTVRPETSDCEVLDAEVGRKVRHDWQCTGIKNQTFILVHDCVADADANATMLGLLTSDGCEVDQYLMTTPQYDIVRRPHSVSVTTYMFKFPEDTIVRFRCLISTCDSSSGKNCKFMFNTSVKTVKRDTPSACLNHPDTTMKSIRFDQLPDYKHPLTARHFSHTLGVEARRINVFQRESLSADQTDNRKKFCSALA